MRAILYAFLMLEVVFIALSSQKNSCEMLERFALNGLYEKGDIMLGGIFAIHFGSVAPQLSFQSKPEQWKCYSLDSAVFRRMQTMIFAIREINRNPNILPNITLGYRVYDNCLNLQLSLRAAITLTGGQDDINPDDTCKGLPPVVAIVGDPLSTHSIAISRVLATFRMPLVSYCATCSCLSNKLEFPSFFRTIPSDAFLIKAIMEVIKYFGWTWIGIIITDDDYGENTLKNFNEELQDFGCLSFTEILKINELSRIPETVKIVKKSTARVIAAFLPKFHITALIEEVVKQNVRGKQWLASEAWSVFPNLASGKNFAFFGGTIGIATRKREIPGLQDFLLQVHPVVDPNNNLYNKLWETIFNCSFAYDSSSDITSNKTCTGLEDIRSTKTPYHDVSDLRISYNVYKAVYALAHALHNLKICRDGKGPFENNSCADSTKVQPWQVLHYLKEVNFTTVTGERVFFDEYGDDIAVFDIVNWQLDSNGVVKCAVIGEYDGTDAATQELSINESTIFWNFPFQTIPKSACSKSCSSGSRKSFRRGEPLCCFECVPCGEGEISNETDSSNCIKCPSDFWSNFNKTKCVLKEVDFLSFTEVIGIILTVSSGCGVCLCLSTIAVFIHYRTSPLVKANNLELSFILLISLTLCFLCALGFIGQPTQLTCIVRHVVFGISFALCVSCILVKTIVVIMAFKAVVPSNKILKWFGAAQQRGAVLMLTLFQTLICIVWFTTAPPFPYKNTKYEKFKVILECDVGSVVGFSCLLGYIGLLAGVCFALAFLARNLPDNFNEARLITFSMLIFCAVWITFIPTYIGSPGKYAVIVEVFAILTSSFGLLIIKFSPRCYVILFRADLNTKKAIMGRGRPQTIKQRHVCLE
ncbi:extracellular calcium-sensing receptor-like [Erpetoichthys calabaricus]|uniref:extracellular calcium-sensing receptor-like n=1 Tax=Erpetoichthys calabaricus TaxID=27687 RepID=UPI0022343D00|nr:extracellular calcium-sensing receptor-like [Erpetoichthys calabaricus]